MGEAVPVASPFSRPRPWTGHGCARIVTNLDTGRSVATVKGALRKELPLHEVAAGRKPSGFSVPDGSRRSAKSVVYS